MKSEELKNSISKELILLRTIENDFSIEFVAEKSNVNKDTISRYENGRGSSFEILEKILMVYNIDLDIFFNKVYDRMKNKTDKKEE